MRLRFWGVRGSTPTPQRDNLRYGGNTPCIEFRSAGGSLLIVDAGTGLRMLGKALLKEFDSRPVRAHILITHYHWDHIQGLPFFAPLYQKKNEFCFHSLPVRKASLEKVLRRQMADPYFPVDMRTMRSRWKFTGIEKSPFQVADFVVHYCRLNHPQGCLSFRIEHRGKSVVYATDNEPGDARADRELRELARGADILIYDAQYSQEDLGAQKKGWGHSSWEEGVAICKEVGVKQLILFHHDPDSSDAAVDQLERKARAKFRRSRAAFEGMTLEL
ncbi:MAG TPA: MBL fold metallo-hydrolase [Terriglobia bacterium]|nr:MBL fold metallo-hydrolase [Terriglobia bacterium]